ncbi:SusD/RagB family nutrient-binding outer membrane lipoprotein [Flavitalea sp. BT771]|uniref:SusD/RagB family nutrient-binding outer membrane lipoprotein n=1 Tax=Flavitalea sp. BT771 TaxID=3063329 RepID=UPI0026E3482E|nr:SusD/RagB family nutrient-binding outer membrane lipoprotein [Flavitalea sp. BT771]MDO6431715.1 SusD/RagB family nutrient-binding outer membrane lipoprotein [Flavitalea sp. BT771]MDV6220623.1 SusD/RagB family nutrient-binding outer membrane lipoprotein [Flavitalea sp. BT771]
MRTKFLIIAAIITVWGAAPGCKKFPSDINVSPNSPTIASNAQLLTSSINYIPVIIEGISGALYTQQWAEKPYTDDSRYISVNFNFYGIYSGPLENLQTIIDGKTFNASEGSKNNQLAVARILRAYFYWHMTDRWGDIPYSQALKAKDNFAPKYDAQKDIYADLLKELKEAAAQIDDGNGVAGDLLYGDDPNTQMDKWRRLANSMRALMALRLSKIDPDKGKVEFADAIAGGFITNNSGNAVYVHLSDPTNQNYWYYVADVQNRPWYWISKTMTDYMNPLQDPRLPIFADPAPATGDYAGVPYGLDGNDISAIQSSQVSFMGVHVRAQNAPCYIVTYAQMLLAEAEADKLGWLSGGDADAALKYKAAIEASVRQWNRNSFKSGAVDDVERTPYSRTDEGDTTGLGAYLARPEIVYDAANALRQIGYQRWVHLYMNGYEAWAEWRRTGYPALTPAPDNNNIPIPRRQAYPSSEPNINTANYNAAVQTQPGLGGKDDLTGRVWWDKP